MPFASTIRLVDPDTNAVLYSAGPWRATAADAVLNSIDLPLPTVRKVSASLAGGHGTIDTTKYFGERAITAVLTMPERPYTDTAVDTLIGLCNPANRPWLYVQRPDWTAERRIQVRADAFTCPAGVMRQAQVGWTAPTGLFEDSTESTLVLVPVGSAAGGRSYPKSYPKAYNSGLVPGASLVDVGGTINAEPVIDIYGPCSDPLIRCVDIGRQIVFTGLFIADGDYLRVDMANRTAYLNSDIAQSRYDRLDFTQSTWWTLPVGTGIQVVFSASAVDTGCQAVLYWRSRWI